MAAAWPLWWPPFNGQFIRNGRRGRSLQTLSRVGRRVFTAGDFWGCRGGKSYRGVAALRRSTSLRFCSSREHKTLVCPAPLNTPHTRELQRRSFMAAAAAASCSSRAARGCAHREPHRSPVCSAGADMFSPALHHFLSLNISSACLLWVYLIRPLSFSNR